MQIGSNDGTSGDPLYGLIRKHREWSALLVEPLPEVFRRLTETYGSDRRFSYADVAIAGSPGRVSFFYIDEAILTDHHNVRSRVSQISSLDRTHVEKHLAKLASQLNVDPATMNKYIRTTEIEAITLPELLDEFKVQKIDILHIDAEGHDWVVLSQLDFSRWQPKVILFEHGHLSGSDLKQAHKFLEAYDLQPIGMDTLCIRR